MARIGKFCASAAVAAMILSGEAQAAPPLQPAGKWVVNFDDAQCVATRDYSDARGPVRLALKAPVLGNVMQLAVTRPGSAAPGAQPLTAQVAFDGAAAFQTNMVAFAAREPGRQAYRLNMPLARFAPARTARTLSITAGGALDQSFALSQLQPLMKVMDECVADLRRAWNVHDGQGPNPRLSAPAKGGLDSMFSLDRFAPIMTDEDVGGSVKMALLIDEAGQVADCSVIESSGSASLDVQSCAMVRQRARYSPATGRNGRPAKSAAIETLVWEIEG